MLEAIRNKWNSTVVTGETPAEKPDIPGFVNCASAVETIAWAIQGNLNIAVHGDVDMDGIGSTYILKRALSMLTGKQQFYFINDQKVHGIQEKHVKPINDAKVDLLIILDSSSNEIETIKKFECNVLVVDHHELNHSELKGYTNDGKHVFVIVNNTIDNFNGEAISCWLKGKNPNTTVKIADYQADVKMSCGLVLYELLRLFCEAYATGPILENSMLYQWAALTLVTDAILLNTPRNQWYMEKTVCGNDIEPVMKILIQKLNPYSVTLSKSAIGYSLAPVINRAIRAGHSLDALNIVLNNPYNIEYLKQFRDVQDTVIAEATASIVEGNSYACKDLTDTEISSNYTGVIAGKILDMTKKNSIVYRVSNGIARGSFRGRLPETDYRQKFLDFGNGVIAEGHKVSFGFTAKVEVLPELMESLTEIEVGYTDKPYLTAGNIDDSIKGTYHIDNIDEFKKAGGIIMIANGNAKVSTSEQIMIRLTENEAKLVETRGKLYMYNVLGFQCKAFKPVEGPFDLYIEQSKMIEFFIK